ncbi:hypothetical protein [uncultured Aquimarina sp.]|nr:hypothetical protein [uncultured Aquimarina sp.]
MKLFNAQRRNLMTGKGIQKYLLYAVVDILLLNCSLKFVNYGMDFAVNLL